MHTFRIIFSNNEIVSCSVTAFPPPDGKVYYEQEDGKLLYALVVADNKETAVKLLTEYINKKHGIAIKMHPKTK